MSTLKVDNIRHNNATSDAITMASDGTCTAKLTSIGGGGLSHRNIIINGAMNVAQRGVSSTTNLYNTVDRMACVFGNVDENPTQEQVDVASGTTPYTLGFRKAFKITNGNQTSGLGTNDILEALRYRVEAQDMATCGWNYTDPNSFITLSFWVKSSVSFNMKGYFFHHNGSSQSYPLETGTLTANTWTKIVRKIPGNSNVQFDNNADVGLTISFGIFGSLFSSANSPVNQWVSYSSATLTNPSETTWYTTNDATLEFTGLQLEVGDTATSFEHKSYADELLRCQRYFTFVPSGTVFPGRGNSGSSYIYSYQAPVPMRASPTIGTSNDIAHGTFSVRRYRDGTGVSDSTSTPTTNSTYFQGNTNMIHLIQGGFSGADDRSATLFVSGGAITIDAEF